MGIILSWLGISNTIKNDDPDPTTGLTSRDRYLIQTSWGTIMKNPTDNGVALLLLYFRKFPDAKQLFPFRDIPTDDLEQNLKFRTHCNSVIYAVASVVDAIDNVDLLVSILEKVGSSHAPRNVTPKLFLELKETMLELFGGIMKQEEIDSWKKALDVVFTVIIKSLEEKR